MSALDEAIANHLQHSSGTMDDPLIAAQCQCEDDFWARRLDAAPETLEQRVRREAADAVRLPRWFWPVAVPLVLALVSVWSMVYPWGVA